MLPNLVLNFQLSVLAYACPKELIQFCEEIDASFPIQTVFFVMEQNQGCHFDNFN